MLDSLDKLTLFNPFAESSESMYAKSTTNFWGFLYKICQLCTYKFIINKNYKFLKLCIYLYDIQWKYLKVNNTKHGKSVRVIDNILFAGLSIFVGSHSPFSWYCKFVAYPATKATSWLHHGRLSAQGKGVEWKDLNSSFYVTIIIGATLMTPCLKYVMPTSFPVWTV